MKHLALFLVALLTVVLPARGDNPPTYIAEWSVGPWPLGIDIANDGTLWIANYGGDHVQQYSITGTLLSEIPTGQRPYGIAVDDYLFIGSDGHYVWTNYNCPNLCDFATYFSASHGTATDDSAHVYVGDFGSHRVYKYDRQGHELQQFMPARYVEDVAVDRSGNVYALCYIDCAVKMFRADGQFIREWGSRGSGDGQFAGSGSDWAGYGPEGICVDHMYRVYVADTYNNRVQMFDTTGVFLTKWGESGSGPGQFARPEDVTVDAEWNVYVTDAGGNERIQKFAWPPSGVQDGAIMGSSHLTMIPNPVRTGATFRVFTSTYQRVSLTIYDVSGQLVATPFESRLLEPGTHQISYSPTTGSGMFFLRLTSGGQQVTTKFLVVR